MEPIKNEQKQILETIHNTSTTRKVPTKKKKQKQKKAQKMSMKNYRPPKMTKGAKNYYWIQDKIKKLQRKIDGELNLLAQLIQYKDQTLKERRKWQRKYYHYTKNNNKQIKTTQKQRKIYNQIYIIKHQGL